MPGQGSVDRPKGVDLADVVNQGVPRTRPLYIHFAFRAEREAMHPLLHTNIGKDRLDNAEPKAVAQKMLKFAYSVGKANRAGKTAAQFARERLDGLKMGEELSSIPWGAKKPIPLPPSTLKKERSDVPNLS